MPTVAIQFSPTAIAKARAELSGIRGGIEVALYTAVNKAMAHGRQTLVERMKGESSLKQTDLRKAIATGKRATRKNATATYRAGYKPEPLWHFPYGTGRKGKIIAAQFTPQGGGQIFRWMFTGKAPNAKKLIWYRQKGAAKVAPKVGRYAGAVHKRGPLKGRPILRQPLDTGMGPPVVGVIERKPEIATKQTQADLDYLDKVLQSQVDWLISNPDAVGRRQFKRITEQA